MMLKRLRVLNFWHQDHPSFSNRLHIERLKLINEMSKDCSAESLLDMACGNLPLTTYAKLEPHLRVAFD